MKIKNYIGDRAFYRRVLAVSVPIMVHQGITNFVSLLDNIMVGRLGTEAMSGVSIVNQFVFIFNLMVFGAISAAGIFTAQYYGSGDVAGVRHTFRLKMIISVASALLGIGAFLLFDDQLISLFLHAGSAEGDLALTLAEGKRYLAVTLIGMVPYAASQVYASTMRETGETFVPMLAGVIAVGTNFVLNLILIFGYLGAPAMGVAGAALATVISRFAELGILVVWGHRHPARCPYLVGAYRGFSVPGALVGRIAIKGLPLMMNEVLWAIAMMLRNQCYSTRGLDVVAAQNISTTIYNLFSVIYMALGSSIGIIVGGLLGAGRTEEAKDTDRKMMAFSIACATGMTLLLCAVSTLFPMIYNVSPQVRTLSTYMIVVSALTMPFCAYAHSAYFTLRSGGKVGITLLFDSAYMWAVVMPVSFVLSYATDISIHLLFAACQLAEVVKCAFGILLLKKVNWANRLVGDPEPQ